MMHNLRANWRQADNRIKNSRLTHNIIEQCLWGSIHRQVHRFLHGQLVDILKENQTDSEEERKTEYFFFIKKISGKSNSWGKILQASIQVQVTKTNEWTDEVIIAYFIFLII